MDIKKQVTEFLAECRQDSATAGSRPGSERRTKNPCTNTYGVDDAEMWLDQTARYNDITTELSGHFFN